MPLSFRISEKFFFFRDRRSMSVYLFTLRMFSFYICVIGIKCVVSIIVRRRPGSSVDGASAFKSRGPRLRTGDGIRSPIHRALH